MTEPNHGEATEQKSPREAGNEWVKYRYCRSCHAHTELPAGGAIAWWKNHWHNGEFAPHLWTAYWLDRYCADLMQRAKQDHDEASTAVAACKAEEDYDLYAFEFADAAYRQVNHFDEELRAFLADVGLLRLRDWDAVKLARFSCIYADHQEHFLRGVDSVASALRDLLEFVRWVEKQDCAFPHGLDAFHRLKGMPEAQLPVEREMWLGWVSAAMGSATAWNNFLVANMPRELVLPTMAPVDGGNTQRIRHEDSCPACRRLIDLPPYKFGPPPNDDSILF